MQVSKKRLILALLVLRVVGLVVRPTIVRAATPDPQNTSELLRASGFSQHEIRDDCTRETRP